MLASIVLVVHLLVIAFNLFGLVVIPVGACGSAGALFTRRSGGFFT